MLTIADTYAEELEQVQPEDWYRLLAEAKGAVRERRWEWLDALGQPHRAHWSDGEYLCLAHAHALIAQGHVAVGRVRVGEKPSGDRARELNAHALTNPPAPFHFTVDMEQNNSAGGDGDAWWTEPMMLDRFSIDGDEPTSELVKIEPRGAIPLEIGSTSAFRTLHHLWQYGGVARWPYESEDVWMLVAVEPLGDKLGTLDMGPLTAPPRRPALPVEPEDNSLTGYLRRLVDEGPTCDEDRLVLEVADRLRPRKATA